MKNSIILLMTCLLAGSTFAYLPVYKSDAVVVDGAPLIVVARVIEGSLKHKCAGIVELKIKKVLRGDISSDRLRVSLHPEFAPEVYKDSEKERLRLIVEHGSFIVFGNEDLYEDNIWFLKDYLDQCKGIEYGVEDERDIWETDNLDYLESEFLSGIGAYRPGRYRVTEPVKVHHVKPDYPGNSDEYLKYNLIYFNLLIDENGNVLDVRKRKGDEKYLYGSYLDLYNAYLAVVKKWKYKPATKDGMPVPVWYLEEVQIKRELSESQNSLQTDLVKEITVRFEGETECPKHTYEMLEFNYPLMGDSEGLLMGTGCWIGDITIKDIELRGRVLKLYERIKNALHRGDSSELSENLFNRIIYDYYQMTWQINYDDNGPHYNIGGYKSLISNINEFTSSDSTAEKELKGYVKLLLIDLLYTFEFDKKENIAKELNSIFSGNELDPYIVAGAIFLSNTHEYNCGYSDNTYNAADTIAVQALGLEKLQAAICGFPDTEYFNKITKELESIYNLEKCE